MSERDGGAERPCTCHPDDNPPRPCAQKYALTECRNTATLLHAAELLEREAAVIKRDYWYAELHAHHDDLLATARALREMAG